MRINNLTYIEAKGRKFRLKTWSNADCWIELRKDNQWWFYSGSLANERSDIKNSAKFYEVDENAHEIKPYPRYYRHTTEELYKFLNPTTAILLLPTEENVGDNEIGEIFYDCSNPEWNSSYTSLAIGSVAGYSPEPGSEKYFQFWNEIAKHEDVYTHVISQDIQVENGYRIDAFLNRTSAEEDVQEWVTGKSSVTDKVCSIFESITKNDKKFLINNFEAENIYPLYAQHRNETIVKFISERTGYLMYAEEEEEDGEIQIGEFYEGWLRDTDDAWKQISLKEVLENEPKLGTKDYFDFWNIVADDITVYRHEILKDIDYPSGYYISTDIVDKTIGDDLSLVSNIEEDMTRTVCSIYEDLSIRLKVFLEKNAKNNFSVLGYEPSEHLYSHTEEISKIIVQATGLSNADLKIAHQYNCENNNIQQNKKRENKMSNNKKHIEEAAKVLVNAFCENTAEPEQKITEMEANAGYAYLAIAYNRDGQKLVTINFEKKKDAKQWLQQPENIGKTLVLYTIDKTLTTNIPVVEIK